MFLRLLFVLLSALNIAVGTWLLLGHPDTHERRATDPGVPKLQLLSELPASSLFPVTASPASIPAVAASTAPVAVSPAVSTSSSTPAAAPASSVVVAEASPVPLAVKHPTGNPVCLALGPFATPQDLRGARQSLAPFARSMRSRQEQTTQTTGWWVYLPATGSRAQALELARQLGAHHISDYFVVSAGNQPNTVSLGLFKDPANAHKRLDEVAAAGFRARMSERSEEVPEYWLDLVASSPGLDWRGHVHGVNVGSHSTSCF